MSYAPLLSPKISHAKLAALSPSVLDYRGWLHRLALSEQVQTYTSCAPSGREVSFAQPVRPLLATAPHPSPASVPSVVSFHQTGSGNAFGPTLSVLAEQSVAVASQPSAPYNPQGDACV